MLAFFKRIKKSILLKLRNRSNITKQELYNNIIIPINITELNPFYMNIPDSGPDLDMETDLETEKHIVTDKVSKEFNNITQIKLFSTIIDKKDIEFDFIFNELRETILHNRIIVDELNLDDKFEEKLSLCCDNLRDNLFEKNTDIFKTKMRFFYVLIAINIHEQVFDMKKQYEISKDNKHNVGVYKYDKYIIRVDNSHHCFESEKFVTDKINIKECINNNVVLPFLLHIEDNQNKTVIDDKIAAISYSMRLKHFFKTSNISFSVQPFITNTKSLLDWIKYNITGKLHAIILSEIRKTFIIHLFYKCACLIETIHSHDTVHGDIKPDNIIINEQDNFDISHYINYKNFNVYLIDFGLSGENKKDCGTGGTTPYCHPEFQNIRDLENTDNYKWKIIHKKHDVWSLGLAFITLYMFGKVNSYYYKYPNYFFRRDGYINDIIFDSIGNHTIRNLFKDILSIESITIDELKIRLLSITNNIDS